MEIAAKCVQVGSKGEGYHLLSDQKFSLPDRQPSYILLPLPRIPINWLLLAILEVLPLM